MAERSEAIGQHLVGAAERIQLLERSLDDLRQDAATDGLTKLANRRSFDTRLREAAGGADEGHAQSRATSRPSVDTRSSEETLWLMV